ncbi:3768_t:CDS:2 [Acaulospora morrowiae]|uniref:3768_t:CDS:1 n=1 Tax=Acaulospora morrowiae TaxID=94023 RepID=A0A9N9GLH2_9GLOM|nr:3768_t:CDS:2 [Acaulospora morrowiae]
MPTHFSSKLSHDYSQLLDNADDYNVSIQVGEGSNVKEFRAHSNILRARSPYFMRAFSSDWAVKKDNIIIFNKPNITPMVFAMMLKYIYAGTLDLDKQSGSDILGLLIASDELLLDELITYCQNHLIEEKSNWLRLNIVQVLQTVIRHDRCKKLQDHCLEYICQDPQTFFSSKNFQSLDRDILYGLLSRDDLQFEEIEIWEHLIKWGTTQTSTANDKVFNDVTKWSDKQFDALKKSVEPFIPLIRFFEFSSKDFYYKVRPYKKILPRNIYEDVMSHHLAGTEPKTPNLTPRMGRWKIDSNIIKSRHAAILANWINRSGEKFGVTTKVPYEFTLLYRGSLHGFKDEVFRGYVNNQGSAIVVIKVSRVDDSNYAVYDNANNGAQFGQSDLVVKNMIGTCNIHSYADSILDTNSFIIEEIEAFKIVEKIDSSI